MSGPRVRFVVSHWFLFNEHHRFVHHQTSINHHGASVCVWECVLRWELWPFNSQTCISTVIYLLRLILLFDLIDCPDLMEGEVRAKRSELRAGVWETSSRVTWNYFEWRGQTDMGRDGIIKSGENEIWGGKDTGRASEQEATCCSRVCTAYLFTVWRLKNESNWRHVFTQVRSSVS